MEETKKEIGRFAASIVILEENKKLKPLFFTRSTNMSPDVLITQLKLFIKSLEDSYYPKFKDNMINISDD